MAEFLQEAFVLCNKVQAVHRDQDVLDKTICRGDIARLHDCFRRIVLSLHEYLSHAEQDDLDTFSALALACRKVAQDLSVHLERLQSLNIHVGQGYVDTKSLRAAWPSRDLDALGARLEDLSKHYRDLTVLRG